MSALTNNTQWHINLKQTLQCFILATLIIPHSVTFHSTVMNSLLHSPEALQASCHWLEKGMHIHLLKKCGWKMQLLKTNSGMWQVVLIHLWPFSIWSVSRFIVCIRLQFEWHGPYMTPAFCPNRSRLQQIHVTLKRKKWVWMDWRIEDENEWEHIHSALCLFIKSNNSFTTSKKNKKKTNTQIIILVVSIKNYFKMSVYVNVKKPQ